MSSIQSFLSLPLLALLFCLASLLCLLALAADSSCCTSLYQGWLQSDIHNAGVFADIQNPGFEGGSWGRGGAQNLYQHK